MLRAPRSDRRASWGSRSRRSPPRPSELPFEDESFDLVFGHAVLHHIPDLEPRLRRVPPGAAARRHDRLLRRALALRRPARGACRSGPAMLAAPAWRRAGRRRARRAGRRGRAVGRPRARGRGRRPRLRPRRPAAPAARRRLRATPGRAARSCSPTPGAGGCARSRRRAEPDSVPWRWRHFAFRSYIALQRVDTRLLEPRLPAELFYNLLALRPQARLTSPPRRQMKPCAPQRESKLHFASRRRAATADSVALTRRGSSRTWLSATRSVVSPSRVWIWSRR